MNRPLYSFAAFVLASTLVVSCGDDDHEHNGNNHHDSIERIEIVDRGQTAQPVVATWTDVDGWTGELPVISLESTNQRISLGVRAINEDGDDLIAEDEHVEARYALATGAQTGIIDLDRNGVFHGDHVHIYGAAEGVTQIRFLVWHDDHADAETDPIDVAVSDEEPTD